MARYLPDVIDKMLTVIPHTEVSLIRKLESIKESAAFAAPEIQYMWWARCYAALNGYVLDEDNERTGWIESVLKIWESKDTATKESE